MSVVMLALILSVPYQQLAYTNHTRYDVLCEEIRLRLLQLFQGAMLMFF